MRRLLYKYFSDDYLHVVHLMACHHRAQRFSPQSDCPAMYRNWNSEMPPLDIDLRPVQFPCGAGLGCGGPGCRWARQSEYPLPLPPMAT